MKRFLTWSVSLSLLFVAAWGCHRNAEKGVGKSDGAAKKVAYHPEHGPGGGHLLELDAEDFGAQWHQSSKHNKIRIEFLDKDGKAPAPAKIDSVIIYSTTRADGKSWTLEPGPRDETGAVAEFFLDDEELHRAMTLGIRVEFKRGEETFTAIVPPHEPHMHD